MRSTWKLPTSSALVLVLGISLSVFARADDQENRKIDSKVLVLRASQLTPKLDFSAQPPPDPEKSEPYKSGLLSATDAQVLINGLRGAKPNDADDRVTIIHILRWNTSDHKSLKFQKWYVHDPSPPKGNFYWTSRQSRFEGATIAGRTKFRVIYVHLNFDLNNKHNESFAKDVAAQTDRLAHPISYSVEVKKQQTQFVKDLISLLTILGAYTPQQTPAAVDPEVGYFSVYEFDSQFKTSTIAITAVHSDSANSAAAGNADNSADKKTQQVASQTYVNEGPSWIGLSFAVPLTSYKDVTFSQTNGTLTSNTIDRQNIYAALDFYWPPVQPSWTAFRYIPHPFFGMPIKKQPLRNTTLGLAMGWRWLEPFGSVVFNVQQRKDTANKLQNHLVYKGAWGLKMSVSDVAKALKKSSTKAKDGSSSSTAKSSGS
jgi:hypothetical protein